MGRVAVRVHRKNCARTGIRAAAEPGRSSPACSVAAGEAADGGGAVASRSAGVNNQPSTLDVLSGRDAVAVGVPFAASPAA